MNRRYNILTERRTSPLLYGDSVQKEDEFLNALYDARFRAFDHRKNVPADTVCPVCGNRTVYASCEESEDGCMEVVLDCGTCGEVFPTGPLEADVFFHRDRESAESIETPFGPFHVKVNGIVTPFSFTKGTRHTRYSTPSVEFDKYTVQIDMLHLAPGDEVFCGFDKGILDFYDSDEHTELLTAEDTQTVLGLCGCEPVYPWDEYNPCCYNLVGWGSKGFTYKVISDPREYDMDEEAIYTRVLSVSLAWIGKQEGCNPELELFLTLA